MIDSAIIAAYSDPSSPDSLRAIADSLPAWIKADHKRVGRRLQQLRATGALPQLPAKTTGRDGKSRAFQARGDSPMASEKKILRMASDIKRRKRDVRRAKAQAIEQAALANLPKSRKQLWTLTDEQKVVPCKALITDPPYSIGRWDWQPRTLAELEEFTRNWATRWNECGADFAIIWFSESYLWEARRWLSESLLNYEFVQLLFCHIKNNSRDFGPYRFRQNHEIAFFFRRKACKTPINGSVRSSITVEKPQTNFNDEQLRQHPCQQSVRMYEEWLIPALTNPGDVIADPFAGSAAIGVAATRTNRRYFGIETNKEHLQTGRGRIAAYGQPTQ